LYLTLEFEVDLVRRVKNASVFYEISGRLLFSGGLILAFFLVVRVSREAVENQVAEQPSYLLIASTPDLEFPPATPLPTFTPTPIPTATPLPLPVTRLAIPVIGLNTRIEDIYPTENIAWGGARQFIWDPPAYVAGHFNSSGYPGEGRNIVFIGHNNTLGEVFRYLINLNLEDEVILYTDEKTFSYKVQKKYTIPYLGAEEEGDALLQSYAAPGSSEMVTLISCWPYATNSHRVVIIAAPVPDENNEDDSNSG